MDFSELESGKYQIRLCGEWNGCSSIIGTRIRVAMHASRVGVDGSCDVPWWYPGSGHSVLHRDGFFVRV